MAPCCGVQVLRMHLQVGSHSATPHGTTQKQPQELEEALQNAGSKLVVLFSALTWCRCGSPHCGKWQCLGGCIQRPLQQLSRAKIGEGVRPSAGARSSTAQAVQGDAAAGAQDSRGLQGRGACHHRRRCTSAAGTCLQQASWCVCTAAESAALRSAGFKKWMRCPRRASLRASHPLLKAC